MLTYTDVSADPTAFERSGLRESQLEEARALGFRSIAWIGAVPDGVAADAPEEMSVMITAAMFRDGAPMSLSLCHTAEVGDDYCVRTLFTDGSIVMTETEPQKNRFRLLLGVTSAPRYGVDLAFVATTSLAELVTHHERRIRAREAQGARPVSMHDLRTHFAISKRWREIGDARIRRQTKIAIAAGLLAVMALVLGPLVAQRAIADALGAPIAHMLQVISVFAAAPIGIGAFTFALYYVAPVLARTAPAPAMRPADDLLKLADGIARAHLPARRAATPARAVTESAGVSREELAHLLRVDLGIAMANAMLFPLLVLGGFALHGAGGAFVAIFALFAFDGVVQVVTKKDRVVLLRERLVPSLVRAEEGSPALACAGGACAIPGRWGGGIRLGLGLMGILAAPKMLALPPEAIPTYVAAEWAFIFVFLVVTAYSRTTKRHKLLAS